MTQRMHAVGNGYQVSCNVLDLLTTNPSAVLTHDGTTAAQLVYGKGMPAGGLYCPGTVPAGPCPVSSPIPVRTTNAVTILT